MSPITKFRTCFIIFILLLSSLSIFVFAPETAKAEESTTPTTLYFHNAIVEDENLSDLIGYYNLEKLQYLFDNINESDINQENLLNLLEETLSTAGLSRLMDQNQPTKNNDSEYPPTLKTIIDMCRKGNWEILDEVLLSYFAPFQGIYIYNGNEQININGDVKFNLYFSSPLWYIWNKDTVNVSFSILTTTQDGFLEAKFTKSVTTEVKRRLLNPLNSLAEYEIPITVDTILEPGDIILAEIDINAGEKPFLNYLDLNVSDLNQSLEELANALNETGIKFLSNIGETLLNISDVLGGDFADLSLTDLIQKLSSSFIYDSVEHKSSLTIPSNIAGEDENVKTYYLHDKNMSEELPTKDKPSQLDLRKGSATWGGPVLERSKILKEATASLYIDHLDLIRLLDIIKGKIKVTANLFYEDENIASSQEELSRTIILDLLQKPDKPIVFTFSNITGNKEITYGTGLSLEVTADGTNFGLLGLRRNAKLLYDSTNYPSSLTVKFGETDHIKIVSGESNKKVPLGGSVNYTLTVKSDFKEDIKILNYGFIKDEDKWNIEIIPEETSIPKGGQEDVIIVITSKDTAYDKSRYGQHLKVTFTAEGKTGKASYPVDVEISEDAVEYNIEITADPTGQKIRHGESDTYYFTIKNMNTGFWPDSYTIDASSEHGWDINLSEKKLDLSSGKEAKVKVTVSVPEDTKGASSDVLAFTVTSKGSKRSVTLNITTTVIGPSILEMIYDAFNSASKSLGLDGVFGSYAPHFLAAILFIILFFIIIMLVYFLTRKFVNVICLERIKEITPEEEAKFEITIQNPYKYKFSYEIKAEEISSSQGWNVSLDTAESIVLEPKQSKTVILTVKPTSFVKSDDWAEVKIVAKVLENQKTAEISTVTTIKDAKPELYITSVFHWPKVFKKGDLVETSFKLENKGNVSASNITVVLNLNGKEKNKIENITIPAGGYADIKMPWIALKGKNEINIVVE
jgi:hypothetical protein